MAFSSIGGSNPATVRALPRSPTASARRYDGGAGGLRATVPHQPVPRGGWAVFYYRRDGERLIIGLRILAKHANARGVAHGGLLMTLADIALGYNTAYREEPPGFWARPI